MYAASLAQMGNRCMLSGSAPGLAVSLSGGGHEGDQCGQGGVDVDVGSDSGLEVGAFAGVMCGVVVVNAVAIGSAGSAIVGAPVLAVPDIDPKRADAHRRQRVLRGVHGNQVRWW